MRGTSTRKDRILGAIYTPPDFARFLASWAIKEPTDKVLDVGVGEGTFVFAAYRRLLEIGSNPTTANSQVYGSEIDAASYRRFLVESEKLGQKFPNISHSDFFATQRPTLDAVVGNPPYVRRTYLENIDQIRHTIIAHDSALRELQLTRMTDLYIYFLLHAVATLRPGGRLAVITADPWLNVRYGEAFKRYLHQNFYIDSLISLDRRVFLDAQVKPVLLLATRKGYAQLIDYQTRHQYVQFIRVKNGLSIEQVGNLLSSSENSHPDVTMIKVAHTDLQTRRPWGLHFKTPAVYRTIAAHPLVTPIASVANTRIGVQTLAKEFFVLRTDQIRSSQIEARFLQPLAQSARWFGHPTIEPEDVSDFHLFSCSEDKQQLAGTKALAYILQGESTVISVRGKETLVVGFQNKERIARASRPHWYDLKTSIDRRGRAAILIPRLVYRSFTVVWNKAGFVPGELFIEYLPHPLANDDAELHLAILSSSITEFVLRSHAQIYGGGTFNINPGQVRQVPILNTTLLAKEQVNALKLAYRAYLEDTQHSRVALDSAMLEIFGFDHLFENRLKESLVDLVMMATSSKLE